jgi:ketosteroid isomerase-like protein
VSKENVEVVQRFESLIVPSIEAVETSAAQGGFEQVVELLDPNVRIHATTSLPHGGEFVGHDSFLKMGEQFHDLWNLVGAIEFEYLDGGDDKVVTLASFTLESRRTGRSVPVRMVEIVTVRDGKITELEAYYYDTVPIIEAGGCVTGRETARQQAASLQ